MSIFSRMNQQDGSMGFADKKQVLKKRAPANYESSVTILTPGCHFNGKLFCRGASRIGGRIEGEIISEGMLVIEEEALVTADIRADEAVIQGTVEGKISATGRVELSATCHFTGDIFSPSLIIHDGAQFNGRSTMTVAAAKSDLQNIESLQKGSLRDAASSGRVAANVSQLSEIIVAK